MRTSTPYGLIERDCPACGSNAYDVVLQLSTRDFTRSNLTYDIAKLGNLGFDDAQLFPIVQCMSCGFQYSQFRLADELNEFLYSEVIDHQESLKKIFSVHKRRKLMKVWMKLFDLAVSACPEQVDLKLLDFGCGWGDFLLVARSPGVRLVGFEVDEKKRTWAINRGLQIENRRETLSILAPFDIVFCDQVLEHVDDPQRQLCQIAGWLAPTGVAFVSVPNCEATVIHAARDALTHGKLLSKEFNAWEHLNYFTPSTLVAMMKGCGLIPFPESGHAHRVGDNCLSPAETLPSNTAIYCRKATC